MYHILPVQFLHQSLMCTAKKLHLVAATAVFLNAAIRVSGNIECLI